MNDRKLSEEAGLDEDVYTWNQIQLERFAELIRADQREIDAKLCEDWAKEAWDQEGGALNCADKIRQRGEK